MDERTEFQQRDISYTPDGRWSFSCRVAGAILRKGRVLLQSPVGVDEWALPGGQLMFGETAADAIRREYLEETGVAVEVGQFQAAAEVFFPVGERTVHQIFLQFAAAAPDDAFVQEETFGIELNGEGRPKLRFRWVALEKLDEIPLYPPQVADVLKSGISHYVYRE